jgi:hypothetical protein
MRTLLASGILKLRPSIAAGLNSHDGDKPILAFVGPRGFICRRTLEHVQDVMK